MSNEATTFVRKLRGLNVTQKGVAMIIASHINPNTQICNAGMDTIAAEAGLAHRQTASKITNQLVDLGVLIRAPSQATRPDGHNLGGRGQTTLYFMNYTLANCDPKVRLAGSRKDRTPTSGSKSESATEDCSLGTPESATEDCSLGKKTATGGAAKLQSAEAETATGKPLNCNWGVAQKVLKESTKGFERASAKPATAQTQTATAKPFLNSPNPTPEKPNPEPSWLLSGFSRVKHGGRLCDYCGKLVMTSSEAIHHQCPKHQSEKLETLSETIWCGRCFRAIAQRIPNQPPDRCTACWRRDVLEQQAAWLKDHAQSSLHSYGS
jgi:hypothetical protein